MILARERARASWQRRWTGYQRNHRYPSHYCSRSHNMLNLLYVPSFSKAQILSLFAVSQFVKDEQGGYSGRARNCTTGETSSVFYVALKIKLDGLVRVEYVCSAMTRLMHYSRSSPQIASAWVPVAVLPSAVPRARNIAPVPSLRY